MPSISELERTKAELALALQELDMLERLSHKCGSVPLQAPPQPPPYQAALPPIPPETRLSEADRKKVESIREANEALRHRNTELEHEVERYREEKRKVDTDLKELQDRSNKLKEDIEKVGSEKALLSQIVKNTQGENEVLSKVMNKISKDYEELKKAFDSQKCPKDDKILALRKTARALETENELLQEEKMKILKDQDKIRTDLQNTVKEKHLQMDSQSRELANVKLERDQLKARLSQADKDKDTLTLKLTTIERELAAAKSKTAKVELEKQEISQQKQIVEETLAALKDSKRFVELKFQNYLQERSKTTDKITELQEQKELLQVENFSLREHVDSLEAEHKTHQLVMQELQSALEDRTRECDARMRGMQEEVSTRLDEINVTRKEDREKMRLEFAGLFDEKASELLVVREEMARKDEELVTRDRRIGELEYREQELNQTISKLREKYDPGICRKTESLMEECSRNTTQLQAKLSNIQELYTTTKTQYSQNVATLTKEICDMKDLIHTKDLRISDLEKIAQSLGVGASCSSDNNNKDNQNKSTFIGNQENNSENVRNDKNNNNTSGKRKRRNQRRNEKKGLAVS